MSGHGRPVRGELPEEFLGTETRIVVERQGDDWAWSIAIRAGATEAEVLAKTAAALERAGLTS
jgi:hypothetical protein